MKRWLAICFLFLGVTSLALSGLMLGRLASTEGASLEQAARGVADGLGERLRSMAGSSGQRPSPAGPEAGLGAEILSPPVAGGPVNRIAFIDEAGQVATIGANGRDLRTLTATGRRYAFPTWSPEARRLAAVGASPATAGIYLMADLAGARPTAWQRDEDQEPFYLFWAPGGDRIGYLTGRTEGVGLHVRGLAEAVDRKLTESDALYWDWRPDGSELLVHSLDADEGDAGQLRWLDPRPPGGSAATPTGSTVSGSPGRFHAPGISASGRYLAFGSQDGQGRHLTVVDEGGDGAPQRIAHRGDLALGWSPTEDLLAYISPPYELPSFAGPLRLLDPSSHTAQALTTAPILAFFWSPDGASIACFTVAGPTRGPRIQAALPAQAGQDDDAPLLLELWTIAVSTGRHRRLAVFRPSPSFVEQFLPFFDQYALSHRIWSPDSGSIVLPVREADGRRTIQVIDAADGRRREVAEGSMAFWSPR